MILSQCLSFVFVWVYCMPPVSAACGPGYYLSSTCTLCTAGYYCSGDNNRYQCAAGKYADYVGYSVCLSCPNGYYNPYTGQTACLVCSTNPPMIGASSCTPLSCPVGQYPVPPTSCSLCPVGYYCLGGQANQQPCQAGSYAGSTGLSACSTCTAGTYSASTGLSACSKCATGSYGGTTGLTVCSTCQVGMYSGSTGSSVCSACPIGTYGATTGLSSCASCVSGTSYNDVTQASTCKNCVSTSCTSLSQYKVDCTLTSNANCVNCPAAPAYADFVSGPSSCTWACTAGYFLDTTGKFCCTNCLAGYYTNACTAADPGTCTGCTN